MKAILTLLCLLVLTSNSIRAQEITETPLDTLTRSVSNLIDDNIKAKRLKITGYLQPQYQYCDSAGAPSYAGGDFTNGASPYYSRFMMRRGRFKFNYVHENVEYLCNIDATEKGLNMRETFVRVTDKWTQSGVFSITLGLLQDQFGFELTQSSSVRETPERARFNQILFPTERDLGAFASMVLPKSSKLYGLKVDFAMMNGAAGVAPEFDSNKDFTGRIQYSKTSKDEKVQFAIASSGYYGGYRIGTVKDYRINKAVNGDYVFRTAIDSSHYNRIAKRIYYGADAQFTIDWPIGITTLRAEYIQGEQPGTTNISTSKSLANLPTVPIYHRSFNAGYFYYIQNIGNSRFQVTLKYDWYDANTLIKGTQVGKSGTNTTAADLKFTTYVVGTTYRVNSNVKLMLFYDIVRNEKSSVKAYTGDAKD
ncbi:MAG: hypothetical protein WCR21_03660, partial [Bacteroidota bacterium]